MRALHTAATGMMAQELSVQVISNNIANMRTTGYKRQRAEFQDLLYEHVRRIGTQTSDQGNILPVGVDLGSGVKTVGTPRLMTQGTLSQTGADLDLAVTGEGFFKVQMPDGTFTYTRDGSFSMDSQGRMVTPAGNVVQPGITIPNNAQSITVSSVGQVSVTVPGSTEANLVSTPKSRNSAIATSPNGSAPTLVTTALRWPSRAAAMATLVGLPPTALLNVCAACQSAPT